jgi:hypothetical protein
MQKLFTKAILKKLPTLDESAEVGIADTMVHCKLFNPAGVGTWYITAFDPETNEAFGFVNLNNPQCAELGYISIDELTSLRLPMGMKIERDAHFDSMPLQEVMDKVQSGRHV